MVGHRGGPTGVYNSKAFELAGVTAETRDPPGGHFYVENGELTGKFAELARGVFDGVGQRPEVTRETRQAGVKFISEQMTAAGLTTVHNAGGGTERLIAYQDAYEADEMRFRMYMLVRGGLFGDLKAAGIRTGFGDDMLGVGMTTGATRLDGAEQVGGAQQGGGLAREMKLLGLAATGICSMLGAAINVIPIMLQRNVPGIGPDVLPAYAFGALPAMLAALAYAILASAMPRAGGSYIYASRGLHPLLGFIASFSHWFGLSIAIGVVSYVLVPFLRDLALATGFGALGAALETGPVLLGVALGPSFGSSSRST